MGRQTGVNPCMRFMQDFQLCGVWQPYDRDKVVLVVAPVPMHVRDPRCNDTGRVAFE